MGYNLLVVDDQKEIREIVEKYLELEGYRVYVARDGFEALDLFGKNTMHLVLLDVMMPGIQGFEVLRQIRQISQVPVIMLTAKQEEEDRILGFEAGADDYVSKPFSIRELVKRVNVFIRRIYGEKDEQQYVYGDLVFFPETMEVKKAGVHILLTTAEFRVLWAFYENRGRILSREQLIEQAFGNEYEGYDRNMDTFIKRIRQKIEEDPGNPKLLVTRYGAGYLFGGEHSDNT